jgi:large subunit ribosomal protein L23
VDTTKIMSGAVNTERSTMMKEKENRYVFRVIPSATKHQIKQAVEELFKVKVLRVNTAQYIGKIRRMGAHAGPKPAWKKAMVKLEKGQEIKPIEEKT